MWTSSLNNAHIELKNNNFEGGLNSFIVADALPMIKWKTGMDQEKLTTIDYESAKSHVKNLIEACSPDIVVFAGRMSHFIGISAVLGGEEESHPLYKICSTLAKIKKSKKTHYNFGYFTNDSPKKN